MKTQVPAGSGKCEAWVGEAESGDVQGPATHSEAGGGWDPRLETLDPDTIWNLNRRRMESPWETCSAGGQLRLERRFFLLPGVCQSLPCARQSPVLLFSVHHLPSGAC